MVDAQLYFARARGGDHGFAIGDRVGHRLLDEHVATHLHRLQRDGGVEGRWREDVHGLREKVGKVVQAGGHALHAETVGERLRGGQLRIADADHVDEVQLLERGQVMGGDVAGADEGDAEAGGSGLGHGERVIME